MHSPYLRHLSERPVDGSCHGAGSLPPSVFSYTTGTCCIHTVDTHTPATYSNVAANTTVIPCVHAMVILSLKPPLYLIGATNCTVRADLFCTGTIRL